MTPEEKALLVQFMGQTHGQATANDQMIVENSMNLTPTNSKTRASLEQVLKSPVQGVQQQAPGQAPGALPPNIPGGIPAVPPPPTGMTPESAAAELASLGLDASGVSMPVAPAPVPQMPQIPQSIPTPTQVYPQTVPQQQDPQMELMFNAPAPSSSEAITDTLERIAVALERIANVVEVTKLKFPSTREFEVNDDLDETD